MFPNLVVDLCWEEVFSFSYVEFLTSSSWKQFLLGLSAIAT